MANQGIVGRSERLLNERCHDAYHTSAKLPEPTLCRTCKALFRNGRWQWQTAPAKSRRTTCPACRRIKDKFPAGVLEFSGSFFTRNRTEIIHMIRNIEQQEKEQHPLERIMRIVRHRDGRTEVTTTGIHLARRIGEAVARSYKGELRIQYPAAQGNIRVAWQRDI